MVKVGIIGGSIGGLTAACLLRDRGIAEVEVFERSQSELEQRGAGIGFLEPASRYLKTFAKIDLDDISVKTQKIRYLDRQNDITFEKRHTYRLVPGQRYINFCLEVLTLILTNSARNLLIGKMAPKL